MHIKLVIIEGFKSFGDHIETEPFSSKVNCVVGANGSGKSNFLHAIRFVLSDLFQNLPMEDRCALLHKGAVDLTSAFVEIVFDNSDNHIPWGKEEVRLRRSIGPQTDKYYWDRDQIRKDEVMNLLESVGFSLSNPYYVVQHGKIASLTLMKDAERLDLLKEIGGIRVYEERRRESLKIMQETGNKIREIRQAVQDLDEKLGELYQEDGEVRKYHQLDKQRKELEYAMYDKELQQKLADEKKLQDEINAHKAQLREQDEHIKRCQASEAQINDNIKKTRERRAERDKLQDRHKSLSAEVPQLKSENVKAQENLDEATPDDVRRGLDSVCRIRDEIGTDRIFGPIIDLLSCDEKFFTAVEVTAGNSLHHVVVDSGETATRIIDYLNQQKGGRLTFIPLNTVKPPHVKHPETSGVTPLLKVLEFPKDYTKAFDQVFGRTFVCNDLVVAASVAREGLDCITLEGDQVSKEGDMTGGFYDNRRLKLKFKSIIKQNDAAIIKKQQELDQVNAELQDIDKDTNFITTEQQKFEAERGYNISQLEQHNSSKQSTITAHDEKCKLLSNVQEHIAQLKGNIAAKQKEISTLSSDASETEINRYRRMSVDELQNKLHSCKVELQQLSLVNNKALDQHVNLTEQREKFLKREAELATVHKKIKELITVLDQRKDESIERTFDDVAQNFKEVFSQLVQGGNGSLEMMKKDGDQGDDEDDDPRGGEAEGRVEKYIGVKVKVSFTGQGETQSMNHLSDGQKTLVALALIFAMQRFDPAPFYLFDEIDAALDPQYRTAVGDMIRHLASQTSTQFITTTFHQELVNVADQFYEVTLKNTVSEVNVVTKEQALVIIEHDQSHNVE